MRKIQINYKNWKIKKRRTFGFYFILITMSVVSVALMISLLFSELIIPLIIDIPRYITIIIISLIAGLILTFIISKTLISPIKKLKSMMNEVANGNLSIKVDEKSYIDEVEDIYHYFNLMMEELRSNETIQSDFISNVSHEFKTPLNAILGYSTLLTNENITEEERQEYINKIIYNTQRMNELIGNILLLSKVDNQAIDSRKHNYSLDEQIRRSILFLEPKWNEKNINFDVDFKNTNYYGNEAIMMHVWNNLIDNAIKFSPDNGNIIMRLYMQDSKIIFTIEDEGPGIPEDCIKYIYNKFYQIDVSHKSEGNGLGLSLVKKILDISDGEIFVNNKEIKGTIFKVILYI